MKDNITENIEGYIVDIHDREIYYGSVEFSDGVISAIRRIDIEVLDSKLPRRYIIPGFIDAHVHIESSMLTPENFGHAALQQGTVAIVTDPHEIANVMGCDGVEFMLENSSKSPIKIFFTMPSCVPATPFDVAGGCIDVDDVERMISSGRFVALSEMMNVPGVIYGDDEVMGKIGVAKRYNIPIDGHAPMLQGEELKRYIDSGISTDHECVTLEEAREKIELGMKILIREGSAALNYELLKSLIETNPNDVMFCCDDAHPAKILSQGYIRDIVSRSVADGFDIFDLLKIVSLNPITHYGLDVGCLRVGDRADFVVVDNIETFDPIEVYIDGEAQLGRGFKGEENHSKINNFNHDKIDVTSLKYSVSDISQPITVISLVEDEIITNASEYMPRCVSDNLEGDLESDLVKIVYINRYTNAMPQVAFCSGFGIRKGAFASSVAHDSHNIIAVGCCDSDIAEAVNAIIEHKGGLATSLDGMIDILPLPICGIMSGDIGEVVAANYDVVNEQVKKMGCGLEAPFMTLSFLSLVVIPEIRIGERGLFSYSKFDWI